MFNIYICLASNLVEMFLIFISFFLFQERLKKIKKEHGNVQLGNITVDMVLFYLKSLFIFWTYSCFFKYHTHVEVAICDMCMLLVL